MIKSFRSKPLAEFFATGRARRIPADLAKRVERRLDALNAASSLRDLDLPGFACHPLKGQAGRYSISVSGPWRVTFAWDGKDASDVDLEQYH